MMASTREDLQLSSSASFCLHSVHSSRSACRSSLSSLTSAPSYPPSIARQSSPLLKVKGGRKFIDTNRISNDLMPYLYTQHPQHLPCPKEKGITTHLTRFRPTRSPLSSASNKKFNSPLQKFKKNNNVMSCPNQRTFLQIHSISSSLIQTSGIIIQKNAHKNFAVHSSLARSIIVSFHSSNAHQLRLPPFK